MKRFGMADGVVFLLDDGVDSVPYEQIIELWGDAVRFLRPSWSRIEKSCEEIAIPLDALTAFLDYEKELAAAIPRKKVVQSKTPTPVVTKPQMFVVPTESGIALNVGETSIEIANLCLEDFLDFCEELLVEERRMAVGPRNCRYTFY